MYSNLMNFVIFLSCELGQSAQHHVDMPETGGLDQKQKVRAAHRGSVTRIVGHVNESGDTQDAGSRNHCSLGSWTYYQNWTMN